MRPARWRRLVSVLGGDVSSLTRWENTAPPVVPAQTAHLQVGLRSLVMQFSDWPLKARTALDIVVARSGRSMGLQERLALIRPDRVSDAGTNALPCPVPDGRSWGLDSQAMDRPGPRQLSLTIVQQTGTLPLLLGLTLRAWWHVRPPRQLDSRSW